MKLFVHITSTICIIPKLDPCEKHVCKGINAICQVVFKTGDPFCACPDGMTGDPNVRCGKYFDYFTQMLMKEYIKSILLKLLQKYMFQIVILSLLLCQHQTNTWIQQK